MAMPREALALVVAALLAAGAAGGLALGDRDFFAAERKAMVESFATHADATLAATGKARLPERVLEVMGTVPREDFVTPDLREYAYRDRPLPIGYGQTISQPYLVALMTALLELEPQHRVLEVGTGSGYQAAVLSGLCAEVYSIEIIPELFERATRVLKDGGYHNVKTRIGDGYFGWEEAGPFDAIVVTAAPTSIPPPLIKQLKPGGRMVIPVGASFLTQYLVVVEKTATGKVKTRQVLPVAFVPLTGAH